MYLNLKLNTFDPPDDQVTWYNLETNRRITKLTGKVGLIHPPVAASNWDIIAEFIEINDIHPNAIKYMKDDHSELLALAVKSRLNPTVNSITATCIEDVSDDDIQSLDIFSFSRINAKCKVVNVVDGDTIDVAMILSMVDLCNSHWSRIGGNMVKTNLTQICSGVNSNKSEVGTTAVPEGGILIKLRLRLYGIDTAEKNTIPGMRCKEWSELKYKELNNIVYVTLMGTDARGRTLANIYESPTAKRSINQLLVDHTDPFYGVLCVSYFGDTKDSNFTSRTESTTRDSTESPVYLTNEEKYIESSDVSNLDGWCDSDSDSDSNSNSDNGKIIDNSPKRSTLKGKNKSTAPSKIHSSSKHEKNESSPKENRCVVS